MASNGHALKGLYFNEYDMTCEYECECGKVGRSQASPFQAKAIKAHENHAYRTRRREYTVARNARRAARARGES